MNRFTFVVQVQPDGPSTLENLSTQERVRVADLAAVGPQIEEWLESLKAGHGVAVLDSAANQERERDV